jgi:hypothetical protein
MLQQILATLQTLELLFLADLAHLNNIKMYFSKAASAAFVF